MLVVEDEKRLAQSIARGLEAEGFDVDLAHDGLDGLTAALCGIYSAIVLDILLPTINGYEVCRRLRAEDDWTPVLMLTAKDGEYDEAEGFEFGADDYLRKPFSFMVLVARLRALARRGAAKPEFVYTSGDLTLDPARRTCARGDTPIELTPREFALLEALLRRDGDPVDKHDLLDEVWGIDFAGDRNIVEVYAGYLRRKIDRPFGTETLRTVRGIGYQVVPGHKAVADRAAAD